MGRPIRIHLMTQLAVRTVHATRYVTPLREGGSLPAIVEADDEGMYVLKFRGAGQGAKALIAELVAGELARALGLPVPEIVKVELNPELGRTEPDQEIQDLLKASAGLNLALDYLPGSVTFDPIVERPGGDLASLIVWFDAYITNVDRTARNTNMLMWHDKLWLIDHGAALYVHHSWGGGDLRERSRTPFAMIKNHVLLPLADALPDAEERLKSVLTADLIDSVVEMIPAEWLAGETAFDDEQQHRQAYRSYLTDRADASPVFLEEALNARTQYL